MQKQSWKAREHFGRFLKKRRERLDASVYDLGYVLGTSFGTVWCWETGQSFPGDILKLKRLALIYPEVHKELKRIFQLPDVAPDKKQWKKFLMSLSTLHAFTVKDELLKRGASKDKRYDKYKRAFGDYLRAERLERGITGSSMARGLGVTGPTYFQWEAGVTFPSEITALIMLDKLHGDTLEVIFGLCPEHNIQLTPVEENKVMARLHDVGHFTYRQKGKPKPPGFDAENMKRLQERWRKKNQPTRLRALTILEKHEPMTPNAFARRMWPSSVAFKPGYVASTGFGGTIGGGSVMTRNAKIYLERLRNQKFVKKVGEKYKVAAKGRNALQRKRG